LDVKSVWRAFASSEGDLVDPPANLSQNVTGRHSGLEIFTRPGGQVSIVSRFDNEGTHLREHTTGFGSPNETEDELRLEIVSLTEDGQLTVRAFGESRGVFGLESSSNLDTWTEIPNVEIFTLPATVSFPVTIGDGDSAIFVRGIKR